FRMPRRKPGGRSRAGTDRIVVAAIVRWRKTAYPLGRDQGSDGRIRRRHLHHAAVARHTRFPAAEERLPSGEGTPDRHARTLGRDSIQVVQEPGGFIKPRAYADFDRWSRRVWWLSRRASGKF